MQSLLVRNLDIFHYYRVLTRQDVTIDLTSKFSVHTENKNICKIIIPCILVALILIHQMLALFTQK